MKLKKLKLLIISLFLFSFCVALFGAGCEKAGNEPDTNSNDPNSIIGKWEWLYTLGGIAPIYPGEGQIHTLEFTEDSLLISRENGETTFETHFDVSGDTLKYHRDIDLEYKMNISGDTLALIFIKRGFDPYFKRIN